MTFISQYSPKLLALLPPLRLIPIKSEEMNALLGGIAEDVLFLIPLYDNILHIIEPTEKHTAWLMDPGSA